MSTLASAALSSYIARQVTTGQPVVFDEIIFCNIPNLTTNNLASHLTMPNSSQIVHRQIVSQVGFVNENAVVYSVTMGTEIGDFDFNYIGLINRQLNLLAVGVYTNTIKKIKNKNGIQGNAITRSILLEFANAKQITNITIPAQTWQIDFTARLSGIDEKIRLTNRDLYGRAVFFDDGFLVKRKTGNQFSIKAGVAYIEGVRASIATAQDITASLPCSIYLDIVHHCTVTGAYQTDIKFLKQHKNDYVDSAGRQHYVQILADIARNGDITDRRERDKKYIPIEDKSDSTDSDSSDTVATSKAAKTAYDKGVEAKNAANNANTNANGRVSKAGDTMTGNLVVPYLRAMGNYISTTAKNADFAGLDIIREGSLGAWLSRIEALPDKRWKFWTQDGYDVFIPAQSGTVALEDNVVRKAGDVMAGDLEVPHLKVQRDNAWVNIVSRANSRASLDYSVNTDRVAQASVTAMDVGGYGVELQFLTTPQGDNYDTDRRHHVMTIGHSGNIWAKAYGWLHDAFAKQAKHGWYPNHYEGAQTFKIPIGQGSHCLLITTMRVGLRAYSQDFLMPEIYTGWTMPVASDVGNGRYSVGAAIVEGNKVRVWGQNPMGVHICIIGFAEY